MIRVSFLVVVAMAVLGTLAACGSEQEKATATPTVKPTATPTPAPMTVTEYAQAVCDPVDLPSDASWRDTISKLQRDIDKAESVVPPEAVKDYNLAALAAMKETLRAIAALDPDMDAVTNPFELATNEDFMTQMILLATVEEGLDAQTIETLRQYGCNVGEET